MEIANKAQSIAGFVKNIIGIGFAATKIQKNNNFDKLSISTFDSRNFFVPLHDII
jgi:hypothetical protein